MSHQGIVLYGRDNRELDILLFPEVLDFMCRVDRVLSSPGGSLLLAGRSGVGRRTATCVVSHMHGASLFTPKISRSYSLKHFKSDLKTVSLCSSSLCANNTRLSLKHSFSVCRSCSRPLWTDSRSFCCWKIISLFILPSWRWSTVCCPQVSYYPYYQNALLQTVRYIQCHSYIIFCVRNR